MKKINIKNYEVIAINKELKEVKVTYGVMESLVSILMSHHNKWNGVDLLVASELATKIKDAKADDVLLENAEYEMLKKSINTFEGYGQNDVEMVKRVSMAENVEVKEVEETDKK